MGERGFALDAARMRDQGYRTVDALVDWLTTDHPPVVRATPAEMRERLHQPLDDEPGDFPELLRRLFDDVLPFGSRSGHPRFFAFVPFAGTWPGALGDFVAAAANVYAGSWMEAAGPSQLELEVLGWFRDWMGYPADAAGILTTGGSASNLAALACALPDARDDAVVYVSDQAHSSLARAARVLGLAADRLRVLPAGDDLRLEPSTVAAAVVADRAAGRRPAVLVASAGATSTGAVDPLVDLAALCEQEGLWLHVDGAYGGFAVLTERGRTALRGIELADSVTLDPHKWLYQPYECGALLVRNGDRLRRAFAITSDYLRDATTADEEVNFSDLGLQLTRASRAFKVWLSLRTFGLGAFRDAIDRSLDLAVHAARLVEEAPTLELAAPPSLGVVCFRRTDAPEGVDGIVAALERSGRGFVSSTRVHGERVLRMCVLNHTTTEADVEEIVSFLATAEPLDAPPMRERDETVAVEELARHATRRRASAGETVVEQWDTGTELYLVVDGELDVTVDGRPVRRLRAGDVFGEIGAVGWDGDYARPRSASVTARTDAELDVVDGATLGRLLAERPQLEDHLRALGGGRLRNAR